ncbi:hypothetical protein COOONC_11281 [Cooperia oncophora]
MVAGDVHVIHFLCSVTIRKLRDSAGAHMPRDMHSVVVLVRVLSLGCCAKDLALGKVLPTEVVDSIFITKFLPEFTSLMVEDCIRAELMRTNSDLGEEFVVGNFLSKPSDRLITFLKADRCAKYQLLKLISQIGYIWGQPHCMTMMKEYDIEYFANAGHEDLDHFVEEYNKLHERLMPKPVETMEADHEPVPSSKPIPAVGMAQAPQPSTPLHYSPFHGAVPHP